jgi:nitrite reductase/ring-hydroxylating ferredoxin subunit
MPDIRLISLSEIPAAGMMPVQAGRLSLLVGRIDGKLFVCEDRCPHAGVPLSQGILSSGGALKCAKHGWEFDVQSGESVPSSAFKLCKYRFEVRDGAVWGLF